MTSGPPPKAEEKGAPRLALSELVELLEKVGPDSPLFRHGARLLDSHLLPIPSAIPRAAQAGPHHLLTIGMATYDDYDGVYFSAQAIRLYHPEITSVSEILVLDNNPGGPCSAALKKLETHIAGYRYVPFGSVQGTAVRDCLFREANSTYVLSMDAHVFFVPGALARLVEFLEQQTGSKNLWQGPLLLDNLTGLLTHFRPVWSHGMYGTWDYDERAANPDAPPFEIEMQGLGVFVCEKRSWPGLNPRFSGFGGEEGYLHHKVRRNGGAVVCLPFLRWLHRFERPHGIPYQTDWRKRIRNYLIGWSELGLDPAPIVSHFHQHLGPEAGPLIDAAMQEIEGPFHFLDAIFYIGAKREEERWRAVGLEAKVRFFPRLDTSLSPEIGRALAHRSIIEEAKWLGLRSILICEEPFDFSTAPPEFHEMLSDMRRGASPGFFYHFNATAYTAPVFDRILAEIPATPAGVILWLRSLAPGRPLRQSFEPFCAHIFGCARAGAI